VRCPIRRKLLTPLGQMHKEEVNVAVGPTITSSRRAEQSCVNRGQIPNGEHLTEATQELRTDTSEFHRYVRSDMLAIELVDSVPSHLYGPNDSLVDQPCQAPSNPNLRPSGCLFSDFADCQRPARACQDGEYRSIQSWRNRSCRVAQIHYLKV